MEQMKLGVVEEQFANIVWRNAPLATKDLVALAEEELNWKRTTTYTVLKKLCLRGLFDMTGARVKVLIDKDHYHAITSHPFVENNFEGSLPSFIAAFTSRKKLTKEDLSQIRQMIDSMEEG